MSEDNTNKNLSFWDSLAGRGVGGGSGQTGSYSNGEFDFSDIGNYTSDLFSGIGNGFSSLFGFGSDNSGGNNASSFMPGGLSNDDLNNMDLKGGNNNKTGGGSSLEGFANGAQGIGNLAMAYFGHQQNKLMEQGLNHQIGLDKANFENQATSLNNQYADQAGYRARTRGDIFGTGGRDLGGNNTIIDLNSSLSNYGQSNDQRSQYQRTA